MFDPDIKFLMCINGNPIFTILHYMVEGDMLENVLYFGIRVRYNILSITPSCEANVFHKIKLEK